MRAKSKKKKNDSRLRAIRLPGHLVEEHFRRSNGRLGITVSFSGPSEFESGGCIWFDADDFRFRGFIQESGVDVKSLDPSADMLLGLFIAEERNVFDLDALLLIRNARDPESVPEQLW